jgi:hypothetical protein
VTDLPELAYRIDAFDRIVAVDPGWVSFAQANGGVSLLPPGIIGRSLWSWIADPTTTQVYRDLIAKVRRGAGPVRFNFRCDAPRMRRLLQMRIAARADDVTFETRLLEGQPRGGVDMLEAAAHRGDAHLVICGWCMRVPVEGEWLEIEDAISVLQLFDTATLPRLSHGMCPTCVAAMEATIDNLHAAHEEPATLGALPSYGAAGS